MDKGFSSAGRGLSAHFTEEVTLNRHLKEVWELAKQELEE